jgi:hypothetical protein
MRWEDRGPSNDVEDRRGNSGGGSSGGGLPMGRLGIGGTVVLLVLSLVFKRNFFAGRGDVSGPAPTTQAARPGPASTGGGTPGNDTSARFTSFVLDDVQDNWARYPNLGVPYERTKLVLFTDRTTSRCGEADAATGPFYCPGDRKVYLDLGFFDDLRQRFRAAGDFAQAYVIAHEIGHHLQTLLGTETKVRREQRARPKDSNALSVKMELQADCYAGVWGHSTAQRKILDDGDLEEALRAAAAIGDDRLQKAAGRAVRPESWTHGSSAQRATWFRRGFDSGRIDACNTFDAAPR